MDLFKSFMNKRCGGAGLHCSCCNPTRPSHNGKKGNRNLLRRWTRAVMKDNLIKRLKEETRFMCEEFNNGN